MKKIVLGILIFIDFNMKAIIVEINIGFLNNLLKIVLRWIINLHYIR